MVGLHRMEVGLGPGDFVFDGDPAAPNRGQNTQTSQFLAHVIVAK